MPNQPIPVSQATAMVKTYTSYMQTLGVDMQKQTHAVGFTLPELITWLSKMTELADEIRICMGDYPAGHPQAGRTTVMLWPYKNGVPATYPSEGTLLKSTLTGENGGDDDDDDDDDDDCEDGGGGKGVDPYNEGQLYP
jgi:hypothetical protein